jgi:hypothetical protein
LCRQTTHTGSYSDRSVLADHVGSENTRPLSMIDLNRIPDIVAIEVPAIPHSAFLHGIKRLTVSWTTTDPWAGATEHLVLDPAAIGIRIHHAGWQVEGPWLPRHYGKDNITETNRTAIVSVNLALSQFASDN